MIARVSVVVAVFVLAPACGDEAVVESTSTVEIVAPRVVVQSFLDALSAGEYADTVTLVDERHVAFLIAVEEATSGEVGGILRSGMPESMRIDFWESFAESLPLYSGEGIERVQVSEVTEEFTRNGIEFVSIDLYVAEGTSEWILRRTSEGWLIDLLATFGADFLPNLRAWFAMIGSDEQAAYVRVEFEKELPSLRVAIDRASPLSEAAQGAADELLIDFGS